MTRIDITPELAVAIRRYEIACARFVPGRDSTADVELPLLAIGSAAAAAVGLPALRELFQGTGSAGVRPRPVKAQLATQSARRAVR